MLLEKLFSVAGPGRAWVQVAYFEAVCRGRRSDEEFSVNYSEISEESQES